MTDKLLSELAEIRLEAYVDVVQEAVDSARLLGHTDRQYVLDLASRLQKRLESGSLFPLDTKHDLRDATTGEVAQFDASQYITRMMGASFADLFRQYPDAKNYIEWTFKHPEVGEMMILVQRVAGKTPTDLRLEAVHDRDQAIALFLRVYEFAFKLWRDENESEAANKMGERVCEFMQCLGASANIPMPDPAV